LAKKIAAPPINGSQYKVCLGMREMMREANFCLPP